MRVWYTEFKSGFWFKYTGSHTKKEKDLSEDWNPILCGLCHIWVKSYTCFWISPNWFHVWILVYYRYWAHNSSFLHFLSLSSSSASLLPCFSVCSIMKQKFSLLNSDTQNHMRLIKSKNLVKENKRNKLRNIPTKESNFKQYANKRLKLVITLNPLYIPFYA